MLVGVAAILGSEVVLSPVVSLHVGGGCWLVWSASWVLKWSCLPLSPLVSGCLPSCGGWVLVGVAAILGSEVVLSPVVSGCLPSCGGWVLVGVVGFLGSEVVLSPVVSRRLRLSPFMWGGGCCLVLVAFLGSQVVLSLVVSCCLPLCVGVGVGWCGSLPGLSSLRLSPFVCGSGCWLVW